MKKSLFSNTIRRIAPAVAVAGLLFGLTGTALADDGATNNEPPTTVEAGRSGTDVCNNMTKGVGIEMTYGIEGKHLYVNCKYSNGTQINSHFFSGGESFQVTRGPYEHTFTSPGGITINSVRLDYVATKAATNKK